MSIKSTTSCLSCENLTENFTCSEHNIYVTMLNTCNDHKLSQTKLVKASNCLNCFNYKKDACPHPILASSDMLCFSWKSN